MTAPMVIVLAFPAMTIRILAAFVFAISVSPLSAHHSTASYDITKAVTLEGTVTAVSFRNPHVRIYIDVANADHHTVNWDLETWGTGQMSVRGLTNGFLKPGDHVTTEVFIAKDGSGRAIVHTLTLPDGRTMDGPPTDVPYTK